MNAAVWYNLPRGMAMKKETQTIEFKQSWHDEYLEWICGYANAYGGTLYIGRASLSSPHLHAFA